MTHVLIVDDNEDNLYYLQVLLTGHGYTVEPARHGAEALAKAHQAAPDLVVSDLLMPVMDGYTLLRHWRGDAQLAGIPFIVYTATYTAPEDEQLALKLGADAFILKPAEPEDFLERMRAVLAAPAASPMGPAAAGGDPDLLKTYSEALIRKLEQKTLQLEKTNLALQEDIAAREIAQAALRASEARFRTLAEAMPQIVWTAGPGGENTYLNQQWSEYTGLAATASRGRGWRAALHPDDAERSAVAFATAAATLRTYVVECRLRRADGQYRWWLIRAAPLPAAAGGVGQWIGTCTDIHDLKEAQGRIGEQAALLDLARDAILVCDPESRVLFWNRSAEHLYGWSRAEALGRSLDTLLFRQSDGLQAAIDAVLATGEWIGELDQFTKAGKALTVEGRWSLVRDDDGARRSILAINTDVTDRKRIEAQFLQAQRMESIGQLTGGVAHDFNNLLTVILGNAELMAERLPADHPLHGLAETTKRAAERGADLTHRLLAFSRRQTLDAKATDVPALLAGMDGLLRRTLGAHIDIAVADATGLWPALVDSPQLENAVLNLCINARDAMPGGGRLRIETSNVALDRAAAAQVADIDAGDYVLLAVSDTGAGMDAATQARAFEPFFTTKEVGKGSGLGLSVVYGFVRQSKGHVRIDSALGQGTVVKLYLPRAHADTAAQSPPAPAPASQGGQESILLVEDDELVRAYVCQQLEGLGYRVACAGDGPEALAALTALPDLDLLFTDIVMPGGMNGRQLADTARAVRPSLAVLFTSGYAENALTTEGNIDPHVILLAKPYRRQDLAAKVREALDRRPGR